MEWIIVDDGTDCVKDIFESEMCKNALKGMQVRYFYVKERMDLGKKEIICMKNVCLKTMKILLFIWMMMTIIQYKELVIVYKS